MGSGGLADDAMAIRCLGVERRGERLFVLSHFSASLCAVASARSTDSGVRRPQMADWREVQTPAFAGRRWRMGVTGATSCTEHFAQNPLEAPCSRTSRRRRAKNRLREREAVPRRQAVSIIAPSTRAPPVSATALPPSLILD